MIVAKSSGLTKLCCNQHHFDCFIRQEQVILPVLQPSIGLKENTFRLELSLLLNLLFKYFCIRYKQYIARSGSICIHNRLR
jgi:hypothetical protein